MNDNNLQQEFDDVFKSSYIPQVSRQSSFPPKSKLFSDSPFDIDEDFSAINNLIHQRVNETPSFTSNPFFKDVSYVDPDVITQTSSSSFSNSFPIFNDPQIYNLVSGTSNDQARRKTEPIASHKEDNPMPEGWLSLLKSLENERVNNSTVFQHRESSYDQNRNTGMTFPNDFPKIWDNPPSSAIPSQKKETVPVGAIEKEPNTAEKNPYYKLKSKKEFEEERKKKELLAKQVKPQPQPETRNNKQATEKQQPEVQATPKVEERSREKRESVPYSKPYYYNDYGNNNEQRRTVDSGYNNRYPVKTGSFKGSSGPQGNFYPQENKRTYEIPRNEGFVEAPKKEVVQKVEPQVKTTAAGKTEVKEVKPQQVVNNTKKEVVQEKSVPHKKDEVVETKVRETKKDTKSVESTPISKTEDQNKQNSDKKTGSDKKEPKIEKEKEEVPAKKASKKKKKEVKEVKVEEEIVEPPQEEEEVVSEPVVVEEEPKESVQQEEFITLKKKKNKKKKNEALGPQENKANLIKKETGTLFQNQFAALQNSVQAAANVKENKEAEPETAVEETKSSVPAQTKSKSKKKKKAQAQENQVVQEPVKEAEKKANEVKPKEVQQPAEVKNNNKDQKAKEEKKVDDKAGKSTKTQPKVEEKAKVEVQKTEDTTPKAEDQEGGEQAKKKKKKKNKKKKEGEGNAEEAEKPAEKSEPQTQEKNKEVTINDESGDEDNADNIRVENQFSKSKKKKLKKKAKQQALFECIRNAELKLQELKSKSFSETVVVPPNPSFLDKFRKLLVMQKETEQEGKIKLGRENSGGSDHQYETKIKLQVTVRRSFEDMLEESMERENHKPEKDFKKDFDEMFEQAASNFFPFKKILGGDIDDIQIEESDILDQKEDIDNVMETIGYVETLLKNKAEIQVPLAKKTTHDLSHLALHELLETIERGKFMSHDGGNGIGCFLAIN